MDEILTWNEASDRSLWHLYWAIQHGADGGQPLFYTTVWLWVKAFGAGVLSLRLYSSVAVCGALVVTWLTMRRWYGMWATAFGVLTLWGTSGLVLDQNAEARFYGLFLLTAAVAIYVYAELVTCAEPTAGFLLLVLLSQSALVLTHVLGLFYGGALLLAHILFDIAKQKIRFNVYLFYAAGWLALLVWVPAIRASMAAGKPHGWIPLPKIPAVLHSYLFEVYGQWLALIGRHVHGPLPQIADLCAALFLLVPLAIVVLWVLGGVFKGSAWPALVLDQPLLLAAAALLAVPVVLYVISHLLTPVFLPRYVLPTGIGMVIVLATAADLLGLDRSNSPGWPGWLCRAFLVLLVVSPVGSALVLRPPLANSRFLDVQRLDSEVPAGMPLVAGWQNDFQTLMRFSRRPQDRVYLLDWPTALYGPKELVLDYHLMQSYRAAGYYGQSIQDRDAFLCSHPDFYVLDARFVGPHTQGPSWFDLVAAELPYFRYQVIDKEAGADFERKLVLVHRRDPLTFCR